MNISYAKVKITEDNATSIIKDQLKENNIAISELAIKMEEGFLLASGIYDQVILFPIYFEAKLGSLSVEENRLAFQVEILKPPLLNLVLGPITKILESSIQEMATQGIHVSQDQIVLDFDTIELLPILYFGLVSASLHKGHLEVEVVNVEL